MRFLNKKGFTLIELLAVIIVLAVVTLLAVQAILPQVDKARKNAFVVEVNHAIEAAKQWYGTQELENPTSVAGNCPCVKISELISGGYLEVSGSYTGYVLVKKTNGVVSEYKVLMSNGTYKTSSAHSGKMTTAEANATSNPAVTSGTSVSETCPTTC